MTDLEIGYLSFPVLLLMIFLRAPIGLAMLLCGMGGLLFATGSPSMGLARLKTETYSTFSSHSLSIIPIFLLMGQFAAVSGISQAMFKTAETWLGHRKGGMAMATIVASAGFGAICGSSLATTSTMSKIALPLLRQYGYPGGFSAATLAAGGTLGILIPPSIILIIYALLTEQNIAKLFIAAIIPGLLAIMGYAIAIAIYTSFYPGAGRSSTRKNYRQRVQQLGQIWPVFLVFIVVIGGIYLGWFTPTEGASIGAAGTGLLALKSGNLSWQQFKACLFDTATSTAMIFFIIFGAAIYNGFLAYSEVPATLAQYISALSPNPWVVLVLILGFYVLLGTIMDSLSMILLTIPIVFPIVHGLDFGMNPEHTALWFGILVLVIVEVGLITPPIGMNLFVILNMDRQISIVDTYKAVGWFVGVDLARIVLLIVFPTLTLFWFT